MKSQEENVAVRMKGQQEKLEKTLVELQECKTTAQEMRTRKVFFVVLSSLLQNCFLL
jgi:hypothetical protein